MKKLLSLLPIKTLLIILGVVIVGAAGFFIWQQTKSPYTQEDYSQAVKVSPDSELRMMFANPMDKESVLEKLSAPEDVEGDFKWEGDTLVFKPKEALQMGETISFVLDKEAKYEDKTSISKYLEFKFIVAGPPMVMAHVPQSEKNVPQDTKIRIIFDRPVVSLADIDNKEKFNNWNVSIEPEVEGEWKWLGTTTAQFEPKESLKASTQYTVNIPSGLQTNTGATTEEDFSFAFETVRPKVLDMYPSNLSEGVSPKEPIELHFNQEVSYEALQSYVKLSIVGPEDQKEEKSFQIKYKIDEEGNPDKKYIEIEPEEGFMLDTKYEIFIPQDFKTGEGELGSEEAFQATIKTAGKLEIRDAHYESGSIYIEFSNPIKDDDLHQYISITPEPEGWGDVAIEPNYWNRKDVYFYPPLDASTSYTVTVSKDVIDEYDQALKEDYVFNFTTEPLDPKITIHSQGDFGFFERNKAPVMYVNAVNVSSVDASLIQLSLDEFIQEQKKRENNYSYKTNPWSYEQSKITSVKPPKGVPDKWEAIAFDIQKTFGELSPGIYAISFRAPEYRNEHRNNEQILVTRYFAITDMAMTLKYSAQEALIWLVDMKSGAPVSGATIHFYNLNGSEIHTATTDNQGFVNQTIDIKKLSEGSNEWSPEFWITAEKGSDFSFVGSQWNNGIMPYNFSIPQRFRGGSDAEYDLENYVYTERKVYRPGDTVYFKGILRLRDKNGVLYPPKSTRQARVRIDDANGNSIYDKTLALSSHGSFFDEIPIDAKAPLGYYSINATILPEDKIEDNYAHTSFSVLEYRKPEYQVELQTEKDNYFSQENVLVNIAGSYFFGAPLSGAELTWSATSMDYFFNQYTDGWYSFALEDSWCFWYCEREEYNVTSGKGKLGEDGSYQLSIPYDIQDKALSQVMTIEVDVTDPNNQVVSNRVSVPVHKSKVYVGLENENYSVAAGEKAEINVITVQPDGTVQKNQRVELQLFSRTWNTIRKKGVDGNYYYENEPQDERVDQKAVTTGSDGKAKVQFTLPKGGQYRIVATTRDDQGRESKAGLYTYAYANTFYNWPTTNNDRIDLIIDKPEYAVGDTANIIVKSPYQGEGVKALVTVERENVISKKIIDIKNNAESIEIPITDDLIPNAYVSVIIIKPREGEVFNQYGLDTGTPAYKIGYATLNVETKKKEVRVNIQTDKKRYGPGETVEVTINTKDYASNPVSAEVSLGVVDLSVISLTGFKLPKLLDTFYTKRPLGVITSQMLMYVMERFKPGSKGGGGGDPEEKRRGNFKDTAFWKPDLMTDENGEAKTSFVLPDNLTTWQLLAIANTRENQFGAVAEEIIETKKVIVRPVRPRFAVNGDEIDIAAIVHNFTGEKASFEVSLEGTGFTYRDKSQKTITLESDALEKVYFPITVDDFAEEITFTFKAASEVGTDIIDEKIPVYAFGVERAVATSGVVEEARDETLFVPEENKVKGGEFSMTIAPTLATYLPKGLEYLVRFPYGCAEQTVSSFLPNVAVATLQGFDAFKVVDNETLEKNIIGGLEKLSRFQRSDGGFGYWENSKQSHISLTAYILHALHITKNAGYGVDADMMQKARNFLNQSLRTLNIEEELSLAQRTYILYVLSETGSVQTSLLNNVFEKKDKLPVFAKAQLAMAYDNVSAGHKNAKDLMQSVSDASREDHRGIRFDEKNEYAYRSLMNTNTRTTALVLQAMVRIDPENYMLPKIVRYLLATRENGHWDTTQSTSMSILALVDYLNMTKELEADYQATIKINGEEAMSTHFNQDNILTKEEIVLALKELGYGDLKHITLQKEGEGRMYYDMLMTYFQRTDTIPAQENGIGILRETTPLKEEEGMRVGSTHKVKLTITVPDSRHFVAVSSPLPAGFEAIDLHLNTSQQGLRDELQQKNLSWDEYWENQIWRFNHQEFRDDQVFLFADYLPPGIYEYEYLVRATTPGNHHMRPARAWEMYFPENFGQTQGSMIEIQKEE